MGIVYRKKGDVGKRFEKSLTQRRRGAKFFKRGE
jgi:hypothetical protein